MGPTGSTLTHLECTACGAEHDAGHPHRLCPAPAGDGVCGKVLYPRYDLVAAAARLDRAALPGREPTLWRYREVLPVADERFVTSLGEGMTPLLDVPRLAARLGVRSLRVKDESQNPTGSFKARGMAVAVSRAAELGQRVVAAPSAGNAGGALAAYAARAGLGAVVVMPKDCPQVNRIEAELSGARTWLVDGLIDDAGRLVAGSAAERGWFDVSTLKEPYRVEGKKTLGYELAEQLGWRLPDVVIYPTGGGTGLVGMWKAFDEMERMGWIGPARPRMVVAQAAGCAPIVRAFDAGERHAARWDGASTGASGLRVPAAVGDYLILDAVRESKGTAVAVTEEQMTDAVRELAGTEGVFAAPEGGATLAALRALLDSGEIRPDEEAVLFDTGAGQKYPEFFASEVAGQPVLPAGTTVLPS